MGKSKNKFKVKFKIEGFELEIEGSRNDTKLVGERVTEALAGMSGLIGEVIDGEAKPKNIPVLPTSEPIKDVKKKPTRKRSSGPTYTKEEKELIKAVPYVHNPEKYGNPSQDWKVQQKALWMLYVLKEEGKGDEHPGARLTNTFNEQFKQSGKITTSNVNRDLGRAKSKEQPAWVGENKTGKIGEWFLTDKGRQVSQGLIAQALGENTG